MASSYARRRAVGSFGERLAVRELGRLGMVVVDRNWRCREGELDIVARQGDDLVVCEVKTRTSDRFGTPVEAITPAKAARLRRLGGLWATEHSVSPGRIRVDVVAVMLPRHGSPQVVHFEGLA